MRLDCLNAKNKTCKAVCKNPGDHLSAGIEDQPRSTLNLLEKETTSGSPYPCLKRASWLCCNKFTTSIRDYFRRKQTSSNHLRTSGEMWQVYVNLLRLHTFRLQVLSSLCQHNFQPAHPRGFALRELQPYALRKLAGELAPPIKSWTGILLYWLASASRLGNQNRFIMDVSINFPNVKIGTCNTCHVMSCSTSKLSQEKESFHHSERTPFCPSIRHSLRELR